MGQEFLSSLSLLKVFLIATIFYQLNVGGYKNMCNAAPIGVSSKEIEETNLIEKIKRNPSILEEKVEELVNNPSKFKQMLVKTIPQLIIDGLERISNNEETNDDKEEYEKDLPRKKRSLAGETVYQPQQRKSEGKEDDTINFFGLELESASGRVWKKAFEKSLGEQNMYNTAASSLVKGALRFVAWSIFAVGVHGPEHLFSI